MINRRFRKAAGFAIVIVLVMSLSSPAFAFDSAVLRSLLLPGAGQAHNGHYTRAALFASAAVISAAGLFATQIHYNRAVDSLDDQRAIYEGYPDLLADGTVVTQAEIDATYEAMTQAHSDAEDRVVWRNVFLSALIATYAVNVIDVLMSEPDTGELGSSSGLSVEVSGRDVRVVKSFSF